MQEDLYKFGASLVYAVITSTTQSQSIQQTNIFRSNLPYLTFVGRNIPFPERLILKRTIFH